jgi:hypothetical protein
MAGDPAFGPAPAILALALAVPVLAAAGCGKGGHGAETDPEKGLDSAILNEGLSRELTALAAYTRGNGLLRGRERALGRQLRAQEQEYADALTKAIRGLGGNTEAAAEELDFTQVKDQAVSRPRLRTRRRQPRLLRGGGAAPEHRGAPDTRYRACRRARPAPGRAAPGAGRRAGSLGSAGIRQR